MAYKPGDLSPDGQYQLNAAGTAWEPYTPPAPPPPPVAAAPPLPPAPPAPPTPPMPPSVPTASYVPQAPVPQVASTAYMGGGEEIDIEDNAYAWTSGIPIGKGYLILLEDIEGKESQKGTPQLQFSGKTVQPNGHIQAGYKANWYYATTEKAVGKLLRDLKPLYAAGLVPRKMPDPTKDHKHFGAWLLQSLRGQVLVVDSVESTSTTSDLPNVSIVGLYNPNGDAAKAAFVAANHGTPPPAAFAVSFPNGGANSAFKSV